MFGLETLDVLIGLVTVYLVFGMACTAIVEAVASWLKMRSTNLELALQEFFAGQLRQGTPFVEAFYNHPLIQMLSKGKDGRPSYIPSEIVGQVVESLLTAGGATSLAAAVRNMPETPDSNRIKGLLDVLVKEAGDDATAFRKLIKMHFDVTMERASGWFKRHTQVVGLVASAVLVVLANVDTVNLVKSLASSPATRVKMIEIAEQNLKKAETTADRVKAGRGEGGITPTQAQEQSVAAVAAVNQAKSDMLAGGFQVGWGNFPSKPAASDILAKIAGLLVSIFAVSLGAPFWFDVLQRFMQVRAAGQTPKEAEDEKKK